MCITEIGGIIVIPIITQIMCRSLLFTDDLVFLTQSLLPTDSPFLGSVREFHWGRCFYYLGLDQTSQGCIGYGQECFQNALEHVDKGLDV